MSTPCFASLKRSSLTVLIVVFLVSSATSATAQTEEKALWRALNSGGHVALLRHALAPGVGDPPAFSLGECDTQRNLSDTGRQQAKRIGAQFRSNGITAARVYTSQWCRCAETARLLGIGLAEELPLLNSFFREPEQRRAKTAALLRWIAIQPLEKPLVLVTHQVNISAATGIVPDSGEIILVRLSTNNELVVIGRIMTR